MNYWQKVKYSPTSLKLSYKIDYKITKDSVSITTFIHGRKTYKICNYPYAKQFFRSPWKFEASKVVKHKMVILTSIVLHHKNFLKRK